ncbi:PHP domain-containing protein [Salidesulfovibrio brasiliensis]|uniref:PHP domain-containing protein n=1 Tax=Salidesulfovibrio brasiliensis TaxID=221711 RepID=UPI000A793B86|nr:PHP domain-containing protein [Salidesulfovibrio brasiliensis]
MLPRTMSIDLHTHTTASDGTFTPTELVELAAEKGLEAVAVTDHDTVDGTAEAMRAGERVGVEVIPGCELSASSPRGAGWLHIVGLFIQPDPTALLEAFAWLQEGRRQRNHEIAEKLQRLGINTSYERVAARATGTVGRPHFAQELLDLGVVNSLDQAFSQWLGDRGKAYVPKRKLSPERALEVLKSVGATTVLAHPYILSLGRNTLETLVKHLKDHGLDAIEVDYTEHNSEQRGYYRKLAEKYDLLESGGSDFHGNVKPLVRLGTGKGDVHVPYSVLEAMKKAREEQGLWVTKRP